MPAQTDAETKAKNLALFEKFGAALASTELDRFAEAAQRLNVWMRNARAYYPEARQKIIELLETANKTIIHLPSETIACSSPPDELCDSNYQRQLLYNDLVKTLGEHIARYIDDGELYDRAGILVQSRRDMTPMNANTGNSKPSNSPAPTLSSSPKQPSINAGPIPSTVAPMQPTMGSESYVNPAQANTANVLVNAQWRTSTSHPMSPLAQTQTPIGNVTNNSSTSSSSAGPSSSIAGGSTIPRKRPVLLPPRRLSTSPAVGSPLATSFSPGGSTSGSASMPPPVSSTSSRSGSPMTPLNSMPPPTMTPLSVLGKGKTKAGGARPTSANLPTPPPSGLSVNASTSSGNASTSSEFGSSSARPKKKPKLGHSKMGPAQTGGLKPWELADLEWLKQQQKAAAEAKGLNTGVAVPQQDAVAVKQSPTTPTLPPENSPMLASNSGGGTRTSQSEDVIMQDARRDTPVAEETSASIGTPFEEQNKMQVDGMQKKLSVPSSHTPPASTPNHLGVCESFFNPDTVALVSFNLGMTNGEQTVFEFDMNDEQNALLDNWKTRVNHFKSTQHAFCLSLACYTKDDVISLNIPLDDEVELKKALLGLTPKWPTNARLQAFIGSIRTFLAPPVMLTEEKLYDISNYVRDKNVKMRIEYLADFSNYLFALYCHPPTASQLRDLEQKRKEEKRWRDGVNHLKRPFTMEELFGHLIPREFISLMSES